MRCQIWSDLHEEKIHPTWAHMPHLDLEVDPTIDLLILAGDIGAGDESFRTAVRWAERLGKPVAWVPGNHEFYGLDMLKQLDSYRNLAAKHPEVLTLLDQTHVLDLGHEQVRLVGGTLWTDFALFEGSGRLPTAQTAMNVGNRSLNDFRLIGYGDEVFSAERSVDLHRATRTLIAQTLDTPFDGPTVVVTHHAPHRGSLHRRFAPDSRQFKSKHRLPQENTDWMLSPCFISDLSPLVAQADVWVHGHVHDRFDYKVGEHGRVIANPRGYVGFDRSGGFVMENPIFKVDTVVEVQRRPR